MTRPHDQYAIDKRARARIGHEHAAPRLEGVAKNIGITKIRKAKKRGAAIR